VRCEREFLLLPQVRQQWGIYYMSRYKDDVLLVVSSRTNVSRLMQEWDIKAAHYTVELEQTNRKCVPMLDLEINIQKNRLIAVSPYVKPTSQKVWLRSSSMHHPSVHVSWVYGMLRRYNENCLRCSAEHAKTRFLNQLADQRPEHT